jgi:hypothetical protein
VPHWPSFSKLLQVALALTVVTVLVFEYIGAFPSIIDPDKRMTMLAGIGPLWALMILLSLVGNQCLTVGVSSTTFSIFSK